jgi:dolichyl-diphosphooligosaccharide--protein glycosyltransferase
MLKLPTRSGFHDLCLNYPCKILEKYIFIFLTQVAKPKKVKEDKPKDQDSVGMNIKTIIVIALLMMLMLFAVHCTWVTSSAYSSPSIVLASYNHDG